MSAAASTSPSVISRSGVSQSDCRPPAWTGWAGLGYVALSIGGLALAPLPDLGAGSGDIHRFLTSAVPQSYVLGGLAQVLAYLALLVFALGLTAPARAWGDRGAAVILTPTGAAMAAATLTTGAALVGAVVLTRPLSVPTAQVVLTAGSLATWLSVVGIALTMAALAALGPRGTTLPRWAGWAAAVLAALLAAAIPFAETPWAHLPALLLDVWVLVTAGILVRRRTSNR